MILISTSAVSPDGGRRLPFYLAMEEWVARYMPDGEYFFTWRVAPTVIFGRNQDPVKEVNLEYCRDKGIEVYRRRSGGGCVYADLSNLMISYICPVSDVEQAYADYTRKLATALQSMGVDARITGRNDVTIDGRKVSGNALYRLPGRSILHGTLLFDTDFTNMANAITPARAKLESHRVTSVESRITTLSQHLDGWTIEKVQSHIHSTWADGTYTLRPEELRQVLDIEQHYYDLHWIFGHKGVLSAPSDTARMQRRVDGAGQFDLRLTLSDGRIEHIDLTGDFFMLDDLDTAIFDRIKGIPPERHALATALDGVDVQAVIRGLTTEALIDMIASAHSPKRHVLKSPDLQS